VTESGAEVTLVATGALLLGGDTVELQLSVGPGAWLHLREIAGTVAYDSGGVLATWRVTATVADGGTLVVSGQPLVVADGSACERTTRVELTGSAVAAMRDVVVLGRTGESGGALLTGTTACRDGRPLLVETLDLRDTAARRAPGLLGAASVVDTVTVLGRRAGPGATGPGQRPGLGRFELADEGTVLRALGRDTASSPLPAAWDHVRADLLADAQAR
jgi:urease accessory protein